MKGAGRNPERLDGDETARELDEWLEAHRDELAAVDEMIRRERKKTPLAVIL